MVEQPSTHPATIEHAAEPRISVIGVGGAGGNAINNMIRANLEGVTFVAANTDAQALGQSLCDRQIQLGASLTMGLGAGAQPAIGQAAAEEALELIVAALKGSNMAFITAGMGGGTGTGGAPVIARAAREEGVLTVGVVSKPFHFEGARRMRQAEAGLVELQKYVDTLIVIPNQNLFRIADAKTTFTDAFRLADEVLHAGVRGVTDLMVLPGLVNLDFADVRSVMAGMGKAVMGTGEAEGANRASTAAEAAISNPLLDDVSLQGARNVLINITGGRDLMLMEVDEAANRIRSEVDAAANIIFGSAFSDTLDGKIRVSVIATGGDIEARQAAPQQTDQPFVGARAERRSDAADTNIRAAGNGRTSPGDEPLTVRLRSKLPADTAAPAAAPSATPAPTATPTDEQPEPRATDAPASARTPAAAAPATPPADASAADTPAAPAHPAANGEDNRGKAAPPDSAAAAPAPPPAATLFSDDDRQSKSPAAEPTAETEKGFPGAVPEPSNPAADTLAEQDTIERASATPPARTENSADSPPRATPREDADGTFMLKSRFFRPAKPDKSQSPLSSSTQANEAEGISMLKSRFFRPAKPAKSRTTLQSYKEGNGALDVSPEEPETADATAEKMHFVVWQVESGARIFKVPEDKLALIEEQPDVERLKLFDDLDEAKDEASAIFKRIAADRAAKGLATSILEPTLRDLMRREEKNFPNFFA